MKRQGRSKKGMPQKGGSSSFPIINTNAAGIDIGSEEHWVAVPEEIPQLVRIRKTLYP